MLAEYDQHARIIGGDPEQMMDAAAAHYLALTLDGTDVLLMAADHALRRELSRRIREDLIRLGVVAAGPAVRIGDGAVASAGDLIICTKNDHTVQAGEPGRTLANGDLLRINAVTPSGLIVRRALDADPATGRRRWTGEPFRYADYQNTELGYAVTDHVAQSRTVTAGLAVITGTEDRQHAHVALTRGTETNMAYVFTVSPKRADPVPGPRPAPELARYDRRTAKRAAQPATVAQADDALAVLAGVLDRDGTQLSASQTRRQAIANADHLAILNAIWTSQTTPAREQRYRDLLLAHLPPEHCPEPGHRARWLWRTLRAAELAGLDPGQVLAAAIGEQDLAGARDLAAVIDARLRYRTGALVPAPAGPWSAQVPAIADPERRAFAAEIAAHDGRPQGPDRRARRRVRPALGGRGAGPGTPRIRWTGWTGSGGPPPSVPGGNYPATVTPPTRSAQSPPRPPPTFGRPGTKPWPPSARPTGPTCAACRTGGCCTCATPTRPRPPGRRNTWAMSSARSAPPPARPAWPASGPAPKLQPPPTAATTTPPSASRSSRAATRPCTWPTGSARRCSQRSWPTALTGTPPPASNATWPLPPTPNSAAATPASTILRSVRPNPNPSPKASGPNSP